MSATEAAIDALRGEMAKAQTVGNFLAAKELQQQIIAHETLLRLRIEPTSATVAAQISFWERQVAALPAPVLPKRARPKPAEPEPNTTDEEPA